MLTVLEVSLLTCYTLFAFFSCQLITPSFFTTTHMPMPSQVLPSSLPRGVHSVATCLLSILLLFHENLKLGIGKTQLSVSPPLETCFLCVSSE